MERVSYSLPPQQRAYVKRIAAEKHFGNESAAIREIIREAMLREGEEAKSDDR